MYVHVQAGSDSSTLSSFFRRFVIPSVPTQWFDNLVHGMLQLLLYAHTDPCNTNFVFLSDTSVPVKPFQTVYDALTSDGDRSRFCVALVDQANSAFGELVRTGHLTLDELPPKTWTKAEVWSALPRSHVAVLLARSSEVLNMTMRLMVGRERSVGGAADELVLPTLLHRWLGPDAFHTCLAPLPHGRHDNNGSTFGCCPTYLHWDDFTDRQ